MSHRQRTRRLILIAAGLAFVGAFGCAKKDAARNGDTLATSTVSGATDSAGKSLYDRLGGRAAIAAVVDTFVAKVAADPRINKKFARSNIPRVKAELVNQVCAETGGPCTYTGRSMKEAHRNMGVTEGEFNALVEDLTSALNVFKVPTREQNELLGALGTMKDDIVEVRSNATGTKLPASFKPAPPLK